MANGFTKFDNGIYLDPQSSDPSSPTEGDLWISDGTSQTEGLYRRNSGGAWVKMAEGSAGDLTVTSKTTTYTATTSDEVVLADTSGGAWTLTLYTASGNTGKQIRIKKTDSSTNALTIDGNATETIDGSTTIKLFVQYDAVTLVSDGTNWSIVDKTAPSIKVFGEGNGGTALTADTTNIDFTEVTDNTASFDGTTFTAPKDMDVLVAGSVQFTANASASISAYIDGTQDKIIGQFVASTKIHHFAGVISLSSGEGLTLRSSATATLDNLTVFHHISIKEI